MHPIHDVDALLLLATALAAKRRPAEVVEIMAAIDLVQGNIPNEQKLSDAFVRLGEHGLLAGDAAGVSLSTAAQQLIEILPRKAEAAERLFELRNGLSRHETAPTHPAVLIAPEDIRAAMLAHRAAAEGAGKNLLVPKPKTEDKSQQRPGQRQRKPAPTRRRKP